MNSKKTPNKVCLDKNVETVGENIRKIGLREKENQEIQNEIFFWRRLATGWRYGARITIRGRPKSRSSGRTGIPACQEVLKSN
jgi:hypothetical protein